jgi:hypothetical protein
MYDRTEAIKAFIPGFVCKAIGIGICFFGGLKIDRVKNTLEFDQSLLITGGFLIVIGLIVTALRFSKIRK